MLMASADIGLDYSKFIYWTYGNSFFSSFQQPTIPILLLLIFKSLTSNRYHFNCEVRFELGTLAGPASHRVIALDQNKLPKFVANYLKRASKAQMQIRRILT